MLFDLRRLSGWALDIAARRMDEPGLSGYGPCSGRAATGHLIVALAKRNAIP